MTKNRDPNPNPRADALLLTPEVAADLLSIGRTKVYELMANGTLASVRIGKCRRVPREALDELVLSLRADRAGHTQPNDATPFGG